MGSGHRDAGGDVSRGDSRFAWSVDASKAETGPPSFPEGYEPPPTAMELETIPLVYVDCYSGRSSKKRPRPQGSQVRKRL